MSVGGKNPKTIAATLEKIPKEATHQIPNLPPGTGAGRVLFGWL